MNANTSRYEIDIEDEIFQELLNALCIESVREFDQDISEEEILKMLKSVNNNWVDASVLLKLKKFSRKPSAT